MALINLQSSFDLIQGNLPVGNMDNQSGPQFDLGPNSILQQDSLLELPINSPFQDLNGLPDPNYNTVNGDVLSSSPFQGETGDHLVDLLTSNVYSSNTNMLYFASPNESTYQDMNGLPGPSFDNGQEPGGPNLIDTIHEQSLTSEYSYQHGPSTANVQPTNLSVQGQQPQQFDNGPEASGGGSNILDSLHEITLGNQNAYSYQHGNSSVTVQPSALSLQGQQPQQFNNGPEPNGAPNQIDTLHEAVIAGTGDYQYTHGNSTAIVPVTSLDLNGQLGPQFDNGIEPNLDNNAIDTLHESALVNLYQSAINPNASYGAGQPGGIYPSINPSALDLNGVGSIGEATFDNGMNSDLHVNLLTNNYNSPINPTANYGQGQPGTTWPNVNAGALDLGGATPAGYTNPETNNTF